jgi:hypothetical protein
MFEPNGFALRLPRSETGDGMILHLLNTAGQQTLAHLNLGALNLHGTPLCNLIGCPRSPLQIQHGAIEVLLYPWAVATVSLK